MDKNVLVFAALALSTLAAAIKVVTTASVMHAALWLAGSFVTIAGVYFVVAAEFIGAAQLLIYAGAVTTLVIFAVMLSDAQSSAPGVRLRSLRAVPVAVGIGALLTGSLLRVLLVPGWPKPHLQYTEPDALLKLGKVLFTDMAVANEVASIILLVALVGAIALSMREREDGSG